MAAEEALKAGQWLALGVVGLAFAAAGVRLPDAGLYAPWLFVGGLGGWAVLAFVSHRRNRPQGRHQAGTDSRR